MYQKSHENFTTTTTTASTTTTTTALGFEPCTIVTNRTPSFQSAHENFEPTQNDENQDAKNINKKRRRAKL